MKKSILRFLGVISSKFGYKHAVFEKTIKKPFKKELDDKLDNATDKAYQAGLSGAKTKTYIIMSFKAECETVLQYQISELNTQLNKLKIELDELEATSDLEEAQILERELAEVQSELNGELVRNLSQIPALRREHKDLENRLNQIMAQIDPKAPTKRKGLDKKWVFNSISIAIITLEAYATTLVWERLFDLPFILGILAANLFSFVLILTAHMSGESWDNQGSRYKRPLVVGIGCLVFIIIARIYLASENWILMAMGLSVLYATSVLLSIRKFRNEQQFRLQDEKTEVLKGMSGVEIKLFRAMGNSSQLHLETKLKASTNTNNIMKEIQTKKAKINGQKGRVQEQIKETEQQFESIMTEGINQIEEAYTKGEHDSLTNNGKDNGSFGGNGSFWGNNAAMFCVALFMLLSITACNNEPDSYDICFGLDKSLSSPIEHLPNASVVLKVIKDEIDLNGNHNSGIENSKVDLVIIGDPIMSRTITITIPDIDMILLQKRDSVKLRLSSCETELKSGLEALYGSQEAKSTNLYRNILLRLNLLAESKAKKRIFLLASDVIPQSSMLDFSKYQNNPMEIRNRYDELSSVIDKSINVKDLSGVKVILFYADMNSSELSYYSREFFQRYLESKNAKVIINSSF